MKSYPNKVHFRDLGKINYQESWDLQTQIHNQLKDRKIKARKANESYEMDHHLLFAEHNDVYTLGKSGKMDHLLLSDEELKDQGLEFYKINRGGDITYHGAGQITAYPIFDLDGMFTDVHRYVRTLEELVINCLKRYDLVGIRRPDYTGVWIAQGDQFKKICAIGVHLSRWVTMHGIAFNVNTELSRFNNIVPCGISDADASVCSLQELKGREIDFEEAKQHLLECFIEAFELQLV